MNLHEIIGYPLFFVFALEIILGVLLIAQNPRNSPLNKTVAALAFFSSAYALFAGIAYIRASLGLDYNLSIRATWIGWFSVPACLQFLYYLRDEKSRTARALGLVLYPFWSAILALCLFTDLVKPGGGSLIPYVNNPGPIERPARIIGSLMIMWGIATIIAFRRKLKGIKRAQLSYFFHGSLIFGAFSFITAGVMPIFGIRFDPSLGAYFSFPWVALTFYAITRYRLFDIRIILSRTLGIALLSLIFSAVHIGLFRLFEPLFGPAFAVLIALTFIMIVFLGTPFTRMALAWVAGMVVKGKYDYQRMLRESTKAVITILDLNELLDHLIDSIKRSLGVENICLYLKGDGGAYVRRQCKVVFDESDLDPVIDPKIIGLIRQSGRLVIREELEALLPDKDFVELNFHMKSMGAELILPLFFKGDLNGVLILGYKGNREPYLQSDIDLLETLAGHAAVALENARLYEETRKVKESLEESEGKFRALAETIPAAIFIHRGGKYLYANPAGESITGYAHEELMSMDFWEVIHPDFRDMVRRRGQSRVGGERPPSQYELKIKRKNGEERWVYMTAGLIEYEGRPAVIGNIFDITDRKKAEEEREKFYVESVKHYQARIEEERRYMQEREKILMDIHDGIGGITTNISLLADIGQNAQSLPEIKKTLSTVSGLAREGMSEIRSFMRSLEGKDINWQALAAELRYQGTTMLEPHNIRFDMKAGINDIPKPPDSILCLNLFRIYKEALTNVIKHSRAGAVEVGLLIERGRLELSIRDNGAGLEKKRSGGRGLSNMKARAEEIGGAMTVTSDAGTSIRVEIPIP